MAYPGDNGRYRQKTDRGLLKTKVGVIDPAAAPVQTDAEASAHPTSGEASDRALAGERAIARTSGADRLAGFAANPQPRQTDHLPGWELAGVAATLVALGVAAGLLGLAGV